MCWTSKAFFIWQHIVTEVLFVVCDPRYRDAAPHGYFACRVCITHEAGARSSNAA
jgi:hypothetical protein